MDKTKRTLILISGILSLIAGGGLLIALIVIATLGFPIYVNGVAVAGESWEVSKTIFIVVFSIEIILYSLAGTLLLCSIANKGEKFEQNKAMFRTGAVLTIICGITSISAILLYIVFANDRSGGELISSNTSNGTVKEVDNNQVQQAKSDDELSKKIAQLRKLKEEGVITDEEFKALLKKLI